MNRFRHSAFIAGLLALSSPALAQNVPTELGTNGDWKVYSADGGKTCYAAGVPRSIDPRTVSRDPIFFIVTDWTAKRIKGEPQVVPGYKYKDGSPVTAQIGTDKFNFFSQNDAAAGGGAWVRDRADEQRPLDSMQHGKQMVVTGTSSRGTVTKDTYSLTGFAAALQAAHKACNM